MDEKISPETEDRIRELCGKISVAHNLDEEIQRELFSHMEDRLLGYLSGAEKLTEEDAFVLVREHFGDPEEVKEMLENVHAKAVQVSVLRRIGAITAVTFGIWCMTNLVGFMLFSILYMLPFSISDDDLFFSISWRIIKSIPWIVSYTFAIVMLVVWRIREHSPRPPWYLRINPWYVVPFAFLLWFMISFVPNYAPWYFSFFHGRPPSFWFQFHIFNNTPSLSVFHISIHRIIEGFLWIWWLSMTVRNAIRFFTGLFGWMTFKYFVGISGGIVITSLIEPHQMLTHLPVLLNLNHVVSPGIMMMGLIAAVLCLVFYGVRAAGDKAMNTLRPLR